MSKKEVNIDEIIVKWFSKTLDEDERRFLEQWVQESAENAAYFQQINNIWQMSNPAFDPESVDEEKAMNAVLHRIEERRWTQAPVIIWWQRIAAVVLLPILLMAGYLLLFTHSSSQKIIAYQEITAPMGVSSKVDLPDGSTVWLNSGSKLRFPVSFEGKQRNVTLSGEAFFKVHSDKKHPFIVSTRTLKVTATGTQFNVEAYSSDTITSVTLVEGVVDVGMNKNRNINLLPNQRIVFNSLSDRYETTVTDSRKWGIWKDGIMEFRDEPLKDVFKRIGRNFNVNIKVRDPALGQQLYRATFESESFEEILHLIQMTAPIQYKRSGRNKTLDGKYEKEIIEVCKLN